MNTQSGFAVTVEAIRNDDDYSKPIKRNKFQIQFVVKCDWFTQAFVSHEPYIIPYAKWINFCTEREAFISLYQDNGEGSMHKSDGKITFTSSPSGAGGDTVSEFTCDAELFNAKILACIERLHNDELL